MKTNNLRFDGSDYDPKYDKKRLTGQILRIFDVIKDGCWNTLEEIQDLTGDPQASISAQLRNLRKERFGSYLIEKRYRGDRLNGLWEYRLIVENKDNQLELGVVENIKVSNTGDYDCEV